MYREMRWEVNQNYITLRPRLILRENDYKLGVEYLYVPSTEVSSILSNCGAVAYLLSYCIFFVKGIFQMYPQNEKRSLGPFSTSVSLSLSLSFTLSLSSKQFFYACTICLHLLLFIISFPHLVFLYPLNLS